MNSFSEMKDKKDKIISIFKKNKNISSREGAYYLLSTSPILRLCERLIFSRASPNVIKVITTSTILKNHEVFLNAKANELKSEIELCEKRLKMPFGASKIADITLNFITSFFVIISIKLPMFDFIFLPNKIQKIEFHGSTSRFF